MSATLRYDIGLGLAEALGWLPEEDIFDQTLIGKPGDLLYALKAKRTSRWGGVGNPRFECVTFAVKLPAQIEHAWQLLIDLGKVNEDDHGKVCCNSRDVLDRKLRLALGLPPRWNCYDAPFEKAILSGIEEAPGSIAAWSVYADWLQDQARPDTQRRGLVMAGWLGKTAILVKYGVPVIAKEKP